MGGSVPMIEKMQKEDGVVVVVQIEKIYVEEAAILRSKLLEEMNNGNYTITVDLTKVTYIGSSCLGVLVGIHKQTKEHGGIFILQGLTGAVRELFQLTQLDRIFVLK